ncbi:LPD7 domain-containing protein [Pseudomonas chlororaphis]|uniref:LPD7 domain-containing protein n=1 Tax=Pseudomonas chlororaphis TaxID=587753 RepID=UPI002D7976C1|nr:LPD7 domain-containing protein [Pseudomonas chlororaphis]
MSVLTFERMKAREAIKKPELNNETTYMSSAAIRKLMSSAEETKHPEFSISGPEGNTPAPFRERMQRLVSKLTLEVDEDAGSERERELSAKDIYTKKSRISNNVHYLDKKTDKTLFVDTGKSIALRRNGITEAGVTVALQLAQQRFGSTLTINGTPEFKRLVVEAAAKGNMDIHFTDKKMNQALIERRAELALEREGQ